MKDSANSGKDAGSVLIIEDESLLTEMLEKKMEQNQIKTFSARDVKQAREFLEKEHIDAILLDIILPGVNGMTFLKELKADTKYNKIPVIISSNLGQEDEIKKGVQAGAVEYIVKANATPGEIVETLKKYMKAK